MVRIDDIAGYGCHGLGRQRAHDGSESFAVARIDNDVPSALDELPGQRETQAPRAAGDESNVGLIDGGHAAIL